MEGKTSLIKTARETFSQGNLGNLGTPAQGLFSKSSSLCRRLWLPLGPIQIGPDFRLGQGILAARDDDSNVRQEPADRLGQRCRVSFFQPEDARTGCPWVLAHGLDD